MRKLIFLLTISFNLFGQPCPDDLNHTNNSVNSIVAYIYEGGVLVDSIECNLAGGSGNINCDLDTIDEGYISLGSPYEDCIYDTDGNLDPSLPVVLDYFEIVKSDGVVIAEWATHTEVDNNYFILEGSYSGKDWRVIKKVSGLGYSFTLVEYREEVEPARYYRLSQVDYDGTYEILARS